MRHPRFSLSGRLVDEIPADRVLGLHTLRRRCAWPHGGAIFIFTRRSAGRGPAAAIARLFELARQGKLTHVITQNIDNLHQDSGLAPDQVIELHGNGTYAKCLECGRRHEISWARAFVAEHERAPACVSCGGIVKTATISFGQAMPEEEMARAHGVTETCDLFLALGSSLVVYPAAGLPFLAKRWGARLVIINREPTDARRRCRSRHPRRHRQYAASPSLPMAERSVRPIPRESTHDKRFADRCQRVGAAKIFCMSLHVCHRTF